LTGDNVGAPPHSKGARTRDSILDEAARLATVEGLDRLSIGQLAEATGMSKSGLYAHFGFSWRPSSGRGRSSSRR
jgi:AcrR family transcriptional regulator